MAKFTVDTHLFRELGELLVGRDSTALVELIKNAYDADSKSVDVYGEHLDQANIGRIVLSDTGVGMTSEQFEMGFLRVASRLKEEHGHRSPKYRRRYTGAKGIGRLAAHKLARLIQIQSIPDKEIAGKDSKGVEASIDWDAVEACTTLDEVANSDAIEVRSFNVGEGTPPGTTIQLRRLRRNWTATERARFFAEVQTFSPPSALIHLPDGIVNSGELLFGGPRMADTKSNDPGFAVRLSGELEAGEEYWPTLAQAAQWVIEIDASRDTGKVHFNIVPTKKGQEEFPSARRRKLSAAHPDSENGPFFQARILVREGSSGTREERAWLGRSSGIRVYMEGFRVLPYGEPKDDWLSLDADYKKRQKTLTFLSERSFAGAPVDENEGLQFLGNSGYFGAVFLTVGGAPDLRMLVNREGFVPESGYDRLVELIRTALYLSVRVRAAGKIVERGSRREERRRQAAESVEPSRLDLRQAVESSVRKAGDLAMEARRLAASGEFDRAKEKIDQAAAHYAISSDTSQRLMSEGAILRVLASVGTQMAAFVHEINGLLGSATALERAVASIRDDRSLPASARKRLSELLLAIGDLRRAVERQAAYLTDVVSPDARRRRSRQRLADRFDAGRRLVEHAAERRSIAIENAIPPDLRSPPMFPAELTLVFSNLLTNAVKAAGKDGQVMASGRAADDHVIVRVENTGRSINLEKSERWFRPFESTTTQADPVLGQGMGMGLPITRNILEEYGATIRFARPTRHYATAVEIRFPN